MLRERYLHPNGQMPAYEWNFGDVNPPVHAWATIFTYRLEQAQHGQRRPRVPRSASSTSCCSTSPGGSTARTATGSNVFEGGFLGLDNIGVFDRSAPLPDRRLPRAGRRHRLDGVLLPEHARDRRSSWRCDDPTYEDMALKFFEHFLWIAAAMIHIGGDGRDVGRGGRLLLRRAARCPTAARERLKVRSMVGLLPLCASTVVRRDVARAAARSSPSACARFLEARPELIADHPRPATAGRATAGGCCRCSTRTSCAACSTRMLDEDEFLSPYGIRSLSRYHLEHPYVLRRRRPGVPGRLPAGRVRHRHVRRQLELARADLDAGQRADHPRAAAATTPTTATTSRSSARPARASR